MILLENRIFYEKMVKFVKSDVYIHTFLTLSITTRTRRASINTMRYGQNSKEIWPEFK